MEFKKEVGGSDSSDDVPTIKMPDLPRPENILRCMPTFSGNASDWVFWSSRFKSLLGFYSISKFLETAENVPSSHWPKDMLKERPCLFYLFNLILLCIDPESQLLIRHSCKDHGMLAWKTLNDRFRGSAETRNLDLRMKLQSCRWRPESGVSILTYLATIQNLCTELGDLGHAVSEVEQIGYILRGLPSGTEYAPFIALERIQASKNVHSTRERLTEYAKQMLRSTAGRRKVNVVDTVQASVPPVERNDSEAWSQEEILAVQSSRECWVCGAPGHISRNCPVRANALANNSRKPPCPGANVVDSGRNTDLDSEEEDDYMSCSIYEQAFAVNIKEHCTSWIVDSGATGHMTNCSSWMVNSQPVRVALGTADSSSKELVATLKGDVVLTVAAESGKSTKVKLSNVLYSPNLCANILSVGALKAKGVQTDFSSNTICKGNTRLLIDWVGKLPYLHVQNSNDVNTQPVNVSVPKPSACITVTKEDAMQLHLQYGHASITALKKMHPDKVPSDLHVFDCPSCFMGKSKQVSFPTTATYRSVRPLECVHSDIWGPCPEESINGAKYLMSFVDDFSRYTVVYAMDTRSELLKKVQKFCQQMGLPKTLHGDNEYQSSALKEFGRRQGMKVEKTSPYCPQQNGVAERSWGVLCEKVRAMLHWAQIPLTFWPYAFVYAARLRNVLPTRANKDYKSPSELFWGSNSHGEMPMPPIVWGCLSYVHIEKDNQEGKLEVRANPGVFIGWSRVRKSGKYFIPSRSVIVHSRSSQHMNTTPGWPSIVDEMDAVDNARSLEEDLQSGEEQAITENSSPRTRLRQRPRVNYEEPGVYDIPGLDCLLTKVENMAGYEHLYSNADESKLTYAAVMKQADAHLWKEAINRELEQLQQLKSWVVVDLPPDRKTVKEKWVFRRKRDAFGAVERYKARLVGKGFTQVKGIDYVDTFAPVVRAESFRLIVHIACCQGLSLYQLDIGNAYLNAPLKEEVYLRVPPGLADFLKVDLKGKALKLLTSIPGLKQSGRNWNECFTIWLLNHGFTQCQHDKCVFLNPSNGIILGIYVDDAVVACRSESGYLSLCRDLEQNFRISQGGALSWFLGVKVLKQGSSYFLCQDQYAQQLLQKFGLSMSNPYGTPIEVGVNKTPYPNTEPIAATKYRSAVGGLLHLARWTRPDIAYSVSFVARFNSKPTTYAWKLVCRILRYLQGTQSVGLQFTPTTQPLIAFSDSDHANDSSDRKSVTGYILMAGNNCLSWKSCKQELVTTSTLYSEYVAVFTTAQEVLFLSRLYMELINADITPVTIYCDNQGSITVAENPTHHKRSKAIDVKYHAIREYIQKKYINVKYIASDDNIADVFTKPLSLADYTRHQQFIQSPLPSQSTPSVNQGEC